MRDRPTKGRFFLGPLDIDVNPLVIMSGVRKLVDLLPGHQMLLRHS